MRQGRALFERADDGLAAPELVVYLPHMPQAPHEPRRTGGCIGKPGRSSKWPNVTQNASQSLHLGGNAGGELVITGLILNGRRAEVLLIPQLRQGNVVGADFGIDDEHPLARVTGLLRGEIGGGEFPLAGAGKRIDRGIPGQHRLALRQSFLDRGRDGRKVFDLALVDPDLDSQTAQAIHQRTHMLGIQATVTYE